MSIGFFIMGAFQLLYSESNIDYSSWELCLAFYLLLLLVDFFLKLTVDIPWPLMLLWGFIGKMNYNVALFYNLLSYFYSTHTVSAVCQLSYMQRKVATQLWSKSDATSKTIKFTLLLHSVQIALDKSLPWLPKSAKMSRNGEAHLWNHLLLAHRSGASVHTA